MGNPKEEPGVELRATRQTSKGLGGGTTLREGTSEKFQEESGGKGRGQTRRTAPGSMVMVDFLGIFPGYLSAQA